MQNWDDEPDDGWSASWSTWSLSALFPEFSTAGSANSSVGGVTISAAAMAAAADDGEVDKDDAG